MLNLAVMLEHSARTFPGREAVVSGDRRLSYAELDAAANQVAGLLASRGIGPGDKVALSCPNVAQFPIVYHGILKAGAAVVPLNTLLKSREIAYHLRDSGARRTGGTGRTVTLIAAGGVTTALLALIPGPVPLLVGIAILAGTVRGNLTLLQATAVADRWGTTSYGHLSALLAAPATIAGALAPWGTASLAHAIGGYPAVSASCDRLGHSGGDFGGGGRHRAGFSRLMYRGGARGRRAI